MKDAILSKKEMIWHESTELENMFLGNGGNLDVKFDPVCSIRRQGCG